MAIKEIVASIFLAGTVIPLVVVGIMFGGLGFSNLGLHPTSKEYNRNVQHFNRVVQVCGAIAFPCLIAWAILTG
ncbi:MAG: hypothetical protein UX31_C0011G0003 [Candidatus Nomurabacteria bacterium GW2011_GWA1_46_11]|uniref:Uncharacterized protein n=2 Tax=Parcubacteria group TaxID=1794811 RepID=A0A1F8F102_9BACT|nr:MAG: hypothetical protein UX31_C0011G0003 [Candidatus Nomurabacteria bacterium GW2011_GWA1_46_11]OGN05959.1 MAG: hypothetical protein A2669_01155 [Candidatus Yanofskybacteria bacterium RIFCSPHIGHO2_01_FULL_48_25b]